MKAIVLDRLGGPETLRVADMPIPQPAPGEIRVRVRAAGLNPADYKHITEGAPDWQFPKITGCDFAGEVDAVGAGVEMPLGQNVLVKTPLARLGGYAEYCAVPAFLAMPIPAGVSFVQAAALPTAGITAYQAVQRRLQVQSGDLVLVMGGAGGVGGFAVQLAVAAGAIVTATASKGNLDHIARLGARHTIDYGNDDLAARSAEITGGRGFDKIVDAVGPASAALGFALLSPTSGALACIAGRPLPEAFAQMQRNTSLHDIAVDYPFRTGVRRAQEDVPAMGCELLDLVARGKVDAMVGETIELDDIPSALQRLAKRHVRGKIVATI